MQVVYYQAESTVNEMKIINRLEESINSLIRGYAKLIKERDGAFKNAERVHKELDDAKETIKELRINIEKGDKKTQNNNGLEAGKKEIVDSIQSILSRLDIITHIDDITNDQG